MQKAIYNTENRALMMDFAEGDIRSLPLGTALKYAHQIANALEAAHNKKASCSEEPETCQHQEHASGVVKVLYFGLAASPLRSFCPLVPLTDSSDSTAKWRFRIYSEWIANPSKGFTDCVGHSGFARSVHFRPSSVGCEGGTRRETPSIGFSTGVIRAGG